MGGSSTSHNAVLRGQKTSSSHGFDLRSWQGLTAVLKAGKESLKDVGKYAEFRDLVLRYAQQGGDAELRAQIDTVIATFSVSSDVVRASEKDTSVPQGSTDTHAVTVAAKAPDALDSFAAPLRRVSPRFSTPTPTSIPKQTPTASTQIPDTLVLEEIEPELPQEHEKISFIPQTLDVSDDEPMPDVVPSAPAQPVEPPVLPSTPIPPPPTAQPAPAPIVPPRVAPVPPVAPVVAPPPVRTLEEYKMRIVEIKRAVNEHIKNPAALMGAPHDLGKKYMTALLSALKATGGGGSQGVDSAMMALEEAYKALLDPTVTAETITATAPQATSAPDTTIHELIRADITTPATPEPEPEPVAPVPEEIPPTSQPVVEPIPASPSVADTVAEPKIVPYDVPMPPIPDVHIEEAVDVEHELPPVVPAPEEKVIPVAPPRVTPPPVAERRVPKTPMTPAPAPEAAPSSDNKRSASRTLSSLLMHDDAAPAPTAPPVTHETDRIPQSPQAVKQQPSMSSTTPATASPVPTPTPTYQPNKHTNKAHDFRHANSLVHGSGIDPAEIAVQQAELSSPEMTKALHQLLDEWSLFSKSGMFGIGPSGTEHPLYRTLAPLSMGELVAGRWEGANIKTLKIIKQYTDAWRHEQGIAYTINETFEHYLRRVVQRILKRQQPK